MINRLLRRIRVLLWFAKRPQLFPELVRLIKGKLLAEASAGDNREEVETWCRRFTRSPEEVLERIVGSPEIIKLKDRFPEIIEQAEKQQNSCPVKMGGAGFIDFLYTLAVRTDAHRILETGVAYGWSSLSFLLAINEKENALLLSCDRPYIGRNNDKYVGCVVPGELREKWKLFRLADREAIPRALKVSGELDFVHYDSDKSFRGRMWAYPLLWKALKPGALFISDDISDDFAFRDFTETLQQEPLIVSQPAEIGQKYVGILKKPE